MAAMSHTWEGKGLRLVDLLDAQERQAVLGFMGGERRFRAEHVLGDAGEFVKNAHNHGLLDDYDDLVTRQVWERTLENMGYVVATAMDGRRDVIKVGEATPLRGTIAPGSVSDSQVAHDYIVGLQAQGTAAVYPVTQRAAKIVFVSQSFAEYLRANGENVRAFERDRDGTVSYVWPARNDNEVSRVLQNYQLATYGANEPNGGELAKVVAAKAPKQFAAWNAGLADQWRMMDALREIVLNGALGMTSGAYADKDAGGEMEAGISAFQRSFQMMAEDAQTGIPRLETSFALQETGSRFLSVGLYLDNAPIKEVSVQRLVTDAVDLSATISSDLQALHTRYERDKNRQMDNAIGSDAGLG